MVHCVYAHLVLAMGKARAIGMRYDQVLYLLSRRVMVPMHSERHDRRSVKPFRTTI